MAKPPARARAQGAQEAMSDDPEIQALIACIRALEPLNQDARERAVEYIKARVDQWRIETVARQGATRREPKP